MGVGGGGHPRHSIRILVRTKRLHAMLQCFLRLASPSTPFFGSSISMQSTCITPSKKFEPGARHRRSLGQYPIPLTDPPYLDATLPAHANNLAHPIDAQNLFGCTVPCFDARDGTLEASEIPETDDPVVGAGEDLRCAGCRGRGFVGVCV